MALSVQASFADLKSNLQITGLQTATVSTRQQNVRSAVALELTVLSDFLTGSYSRSTLISPLKKADVDIFVVLDPSYFHHYDSGKNGGQAGLLDRLKAVLKRTYPSSPNVSRNGQAVTITFSDFSVDVVPAFNRKGGGYLIPSSASGTWLSTDPREHVKLVSASNSLHDGDLVPLIKMIKSWNRENGSLFRSFHLEVLALQVFLGVTISDYPSGARFFFDKAKALVDLKNPDPAGYGDDVGSYLNSTQKRTDAKARLQTAYERAIRAEEYAKSGAVSDAVGRWRLVFGDCFPAYG